MEITISVFDNKNAEPPALMKFLIATSSLSRKELSPGKLNNACTLLMFPRPTECRVRLSTLTPAQHARACERVDPMVLESLVRGKSEKSCAWRMSMKACSSSTDGEI